MYLPISERKADYQYTNMLSAIVNNGLRGSSRQGIDCITLLYAYKMDFFLPNGFPVITERDISSFWRAPIDELFAFLCGVRNEPELRERGIKWWKPWATASKCTKRGLIEGDLGPGSYGDAFHDYPSYDGKPFDQIAELVTQIRQYPEERRHMITNWIPPRVFRTRNPDSSVTIAPCHGSLVKVRILSDTLNLQMVQRSGDVPVGVPSNMIQYAALMLALCQILGFKPGYYSHIILDPHIYDDQLPAVEQILARIPKTLPTVKINTEGQSITDIHNFRGSHFELSDYDASPAIPSIPVAS